MNEIALKAMNRVHCPRCGASDWMEHRADVDGLWPVACRNCEGVVAQPARLNNALMILFNLYEEER